MSNWKNVHKSFHSVSSRIVMCVCQCMKMNLFWIKSKQPYIPFLCIFHRNTCTSDIEHVYFTSYAWKRAFSHSEAVIDRYIYCLYIELTAYPKTQSCVWVIACKVNPFTLRVPLESIVCFFHTFENNLGMERKFTKYL